MTRTVTLITFTVFTLFLIITKYSTASQAETEDPFYSSVPSAYMDDPKRNEWQKPDQVIEHLLIKQGETVADIGAGTGFFTSKFAKKVGKNGTVYASDIDKKMVDFIEKRVKKEGLKNIKVIHAKADDPLIPKETTDLIFICDTYLFIEDRVNYLTHLRESLKKNGRLAIISFNPSAEVSGAPPLQRMISKSTVIKEAADAGFTLEADYFFIPSQDFMLFRKNYL